MMAATAKHDRLWGAAPPTCRPIVMPRQTAPAAAPRASSRADPSGVARSDIFLPLPVGIRRLHRSSMTNAYWIITDATHGFSATGDARLTDSEREIPD